MLEDINARLQEAEADQVSDELLEESVAGIKHCLELDPESIEARFGECQNKPLLVLQAKALVYVYGLMSKYDEAMSELEAIKAAGGDDERWRVMKQELENMMFDMEEEEVQTNCVYLTKHQLI